MALKANRTEMIDQLGGLQTQLNEFMTMFQDHLADFQTLSTQVQTIQAGGGGGGSAGVPSLPAETQACTCAICADDAEGFCVPWGNSSACDCLLDEPSTSAPFRQEFDFVQTPPCCRPEWPANLRLVQVSLQPEGLPVS